MKTLAIVGALYLVSGAWCLFNPQVAGTYVGYGMPSSLAYAEFFTVYGGLQLGLGLAMVCASRSARFLEGALFMSLIVSWCLFAARLISMMLFPVVLSNANALAMGFLEFVLALVLSVAFLKMYRESGA